MNTRTFGPVEIEGYDAVGNCMRFDEKKLSGWLSMRDAVLGNITNLRPSHLPMYLKARM